MTNLINKVDIKRFIFAGNSTFTIVNNLTTNRFTYKVKKPKEGDVFFVLVLTGSDNVNNYSFIGYIKNGLFYHSKKSRISEDSTSFKAFSWFYKNISNLPVIIDVFHQGKCGRCGRALTTPESIKRGLGPECSNLIS